MAAKTKKKTTKKKGKGKKETPEEKEFIKKEAERQDITVSKLLYRLIKKEFFNKEAAAND